MLRHDDDRAFLALEDSVDAHLLLFSLGGLIGSIVLQHLQQRFKRLVRAPQASGLRAGRPLKLIDEVYDLKLRRERIDLLLLVGIIDVLESCGGLISYFTDILGSQLQLDLLIDALRLIDLPGEVSLDLVTIGYDHILDPDLRHPSHVLLQVVGELEAQP